MQFFQMHLWGGMQQQLSPNHYRHHTSPAQKEIFIIFLGVTGQMTKGRTALVNAVCLGFFSQHQ